MNGIIEVYDNFGLEYQYITLKMERDALYITPCYLLYQDEPKRLPIHQLKDIEFSTKDNRKTISFSHENVFYFLIENGTFSLINLAHFLHSACFAYDERYIPLPKEFQH